MRKVGSGGSITALATWVRWEELGSITPGTDSALQLRYGAAASAHANVRRVHASRGEAGRLF